MKNKRISMITCTALLFSITTLSGCFQTTKKDHEDIVILYENDVHCAVDGYSKIAAMMIQGNTRGIIKGYKNLNQLAASDERVTALSRKLLDYEQANIRQMQGFL
mgnify:CR=1 FL=1